MKRPIIRIDEDKCNGCGQCILDCAEGALAIVNGKAKLISDVYCDGLGACLNCPQGALSLIARDAPAFNEQAAMEAKAAREKKTGFTPLFPLSSQSEYSAQIKTEEKLQASLSSSLTTWPIQLRLMPARADYLQGAHLLLAAQCSGFALPNLHADWIKGRIPIIACPKLEDNAELIRKLAEILENNEIASITVLRMSVPCCNMEKIVREAMKKSGQIAPWAVHVVQKH